MDACFGNIYVTGTDGGHQTHLKGKETGSDPAPVVFCRLPPWSVGIPWVPPCGAVWPASALPRLGSMILDRLLSLDFPICKMRILLPLTEFFSGHEIMSSRA